MFNIFTALGVFAGAGRRMSRSPVSFTPTLEALEDRELLAAIDFLWNAPADGLWSNKANWQDKGTGKVALRAPQPGEGDRIYFTDVSQKGSNNEIVGAGGGLLDIAEFQVTGHTGTITLDKGLKIGGTTNVTTGTITGAGNIVISGNSTFSWSGGAVSGTSGAKLVIEAGSKLNISGPATPNLLMDGRNLENLGTVSLLTGTVDFRGGTGISIRNSNLFELSAGTSITTPTAAPSKFENLALANAKLQVKAVAGKFAGFLALNLVNNNQATVVVPSGSGLELYGGATLSGTVDLGGVTTQIRFALPSDASQAASYKLDDGLKLTGQGSVQALGLVVNQQWTQAAWLEIPDKVTIDFTDKINLLTAGASIIGPGTLRFASGTSRIDNTYIRGSAILKVETAATLKFGWNQAFQLNQANSIQIYGQSKIDSSGTIIFDGSGTGMDVYLYQEALLQVTSSGQVVQPARFPSNGNVIFSDQTNIRNYVGEKQGSINSQGAVFRKPAGSGITQIDVPTTLPSHYFDFDKATGTRIKFTNATFGTPPAGKQSSLLQGGPLETAADGSVRILPGSSLYGGGIIEDTPSVTNSGALHVGDNLATGALALTSNFIQDAAGSLNVELGGTLPGDTYDQLSINGTVTLAGWLSVRLISGFTPSFGQTFTILDNDGADPILPTTFAGMPDGSIFSLDGWLTQISYVGGTGNDVVLTIVSSNVGQSASELVYVTSEYTVSPGPWSGWQATGAPNTVRYGDESTSWATFFPDDGTHHIILRFPTAVYATGVTIRETFNNGFVTEVVLIEPNGTAHSIWTGTDPTPANVMADFTISFPARTYLVDRVQIYINTQHVQGLDAWEEIDAVMLHGSAGGGGSGLMAGGGGLAAAGPSSLIGRTSVSSLRVAGRPPIATLSVIGPIRVGSPVTFRFTNPQATGLRYSFDFNNDGDFTDAGEVSDSTSASATHTFRTRGWHIVHGRVRTADGLFRDFWIRVFVE